MPNTGRRQLLLLSGLALSGLACASLVVTLSAARADEGGQTDAGRPETSDIELVVDGQPRTTWTVAQLMQGRFDWESPKGQFYPAVPLSFVLFSERSGLSREAIADLRLVGPKGVLELEGDDLFLIDELLFKLDVGRGGIWQVAGRDKAAEGRMVARLGNRGLKKVDRIEVSLERSPPASQAAEGSRDVILATTTSTQDSGLLDELIPLFEAETGYRVKTIAVGTGEALAMASRGDADVILAHAPALEKKYVSEGSLVNRRLVMHNDFVLMGPAADPAAVGGMQSAVRALQQIAGAKARFVSRGDNSGTHFREKSLWQAAELEPGGAWYLQAGQGMGATLMIASEKQGYTLTDRATFLALAKRLALEPLVEGDPLLLNLYSVSEVDPKRFPRMNSGGAKAFGDFLLSPETQSRIERFGVEKFGQPLFFPDAGKSEEALGG